MKILFDQNFNVSVILNQASSVLAGSNVTIMMGGSVSVQGTDTNQIESSGNITNEVTGSNTETSDIETTESTVDENESTSDEVTDNKENTGVGETMRIHIPEEAVDNTVTEELTDENTDSELPEDGELSEQEALPEDGELSEQEALPEDGELSEQEALPENGLSVEEIPVDGDMMIDGNMGMGGMEGVDMSGMTGEVKDPLLSGWPAVIGISATTLVVGAIIGVLLAFKKIKKGFDLYED